MKKLSEKITDYLYSQQVIPESMRSVYQYGMQMALEIGCSVIASIFIISLFHMYVEGLLFFAVFIPFRSYLGGFHMKSYPACFLCSCGVLAGMLLLVKNIEPGPAVSWAILIVSAAVIGHKAYRDKKPEEKGYFFTRICVLSGLLFAAAGIFTGLGNFSLLFLLAATGALVAVSGKLASPY